MFRQDGDNAGTYTSVGRSPKRAIYIQAADLATSSYKSWGFNNCFAVSFDPTHSADGVMEATLSFKFAPETEAGVPNVKYKKVAVTALPAWGAL
jgi:hypothetical protein